MLTEGFSSGALGLTTVAAAVTGALIASMTTLFVFFARERRNRRTARVALFGELLSYRTHAATAARELPTLATSRRHITELRKAKYREAVFSFEQLIKVGSLKDNDIRRLTQLWLLIRNDNIHIDDAICEIEIEGEFDLTQIKERLLRHSVSADGVIKAIGGGHSRLRRLDRRVEHRQ